MTFEFICINAQFPDAGQTQLNQFCNQHCIISIEKQFVLDGANSFWSICINYNDSLTSSSSKALSNSKRSTIDYREVLNEHDFAIYADLRTLRKQLAERDKVPPYALFTNQQLADMTTKRITTLAELGNINGVGKSRLDKYGADFIERLQQAFESTQPQNDETPSH